ncbi:MAG: hypothetical protein J5818_04350, partial [Eggerthellaceae bacterium]|nr:hypothetical protein [Eggerthellaceae bacterium]
MKFVTVSGPPSAGKTSVILRVIEGLNRDDARVGVVKFDCFNSADDEMYERHQVPIKVGLAGNLCPDHFFIINVEDGVQWGKRNGFDYLISESAGLCNRCSPHVRDVLAICVIDNLAGINTPKKIGPMLRFADIVAVTKGDIVSQAEREVFYRNIRQVNPKARIVPVNGITGQGCNRLVQLIAATDDTDSLLGSHLRFTMPSCLC